MAKRSASWLAASFSDYCQGFIRQTPRDPFQELELLGQSDVEALLLIEAINSAIEPEGFQVEQIREDLKRALRDTQSVAFYENGLQILSSAPYADGPEPEWFPEVDTSTTNDIKGAAVVLATCRRFNICHDRSIYLANACKPVFCGPGGINGYVRRRLGSEHASQAELYAVFLANSINASN